ncbi:MAG: aldo/keto reductase [Burkholderiales bacterium]|nr:aldo/keto reductase [Burkholderiales bacterium]
MPHPTPPNPRRRLLLQAAGTTALLAAMTDAHSASTPAGLITRPIPRSSERLPAVGLGTWQVFDVPENQLGGTELREVMRRFIALGGKVIDSSPMYGHSEAAVGTLATALNARKSLFLATKVWTSGRAAGIRQMEESMRLLQTNVIDLMQVHNLLDLKTHLPVLREWKKAGRIRYLGITHYTAGSHAELEKLVRSGDFDFVQFNYSLDEPEADARLLPACADSGTATLINRPFSQAGLFSKVRGKPLPPWCADLDCSSWAQFFLKWIISHPAVTCAIPGTRLVRHIEDNMLACRGRLPDAAMRKRMAAYINSP